MLLGIGVALLVILTLVGGAWLALWYVLKPSPASRPPLAEGLPPELREANRAFSLRIVNAFPVGSAEAALVRTLDAQGFRRRESAGRQQSSFVQQAFPCRHTWSIDWSADEQGRITAITAIYDPVCL
ncbi:hypothetical protein [Methylorubrum populi]|nr:hypothetical protein [Methylorubrum populi]